MVRCSALVVLLVFTVNVGSERTDKSRAKLPRGDIVPFMLVVEHEEGSRCAGALVSLRSAISTASCARLRTGSLFVLAGPYLTGMTTFKEGARKISSIVLPNGYVRGEGFAGAVNDVALLRLEKPFGNTKLVRPILIEKDIHEREGKLCSLVRAMKAPVMRQRRGRREEHTKEHPEESFTGAPPPRNLGFTSFNEPLFSADQDNNSTTIPLVNNSTVNTYYYHTTIQDLINENKSSTPGVTLNQDDNSMTIPLVNNLTANNVNAELNLTSHTTIQDLINENKSSTPGVTLNQDDNSMTIPLVNNLTVNNVNVELNLTSHTTIQDLINENKSSTPGVTLNQDDNSMNVPLVYNSTVNNVNVELNLTSHTTIQDLINENKSSTPGVTLNYISEDTYEDTTTILKNIFNISTTVEATTTTNVFTKAKTPNIRFKDPLVVPETTRKGEYDNQESEDREVRNISGIHKRSLDGKRDNHVIIFRIFDVHTLSSEQCRRDNMLGDNQHWASMSKHVICTHGASFCQSDWGTGLVCDGKLCGVLSRVAHPTGQPIGAGCGTTHTLQSLPRWRRFFDCAHDPGACDELPCSKYCNEIQPTDEDNVKRKHPRPAERSRNMSSSSRAKTPLGKPPQRNLVKLSSYTDEENDRMVIEISNDKYKQKDEKKGGDSEESYSDVSQDGSEFSETSSDDERVKIKTKPRKQYFDQPTRSTKRPGSRKIDFSQPTSRTTTPNLEMIAYEPYRADFKPGEYGENSIESAAEYRDISEDDYSGRANSTSHKTSVLASVAITETTESIFASADHQSWWGSSPAAVERSGPIVHELIPERKVNQNLDVSRAPKSLAKSTKSPEFFTSLLSIVLVFHLSQ